MIKVFVFGITGRMGQNLKRLLENHPKLELVGGFHQNSHQKLHQPLAVDPKPDVILDFSLPQALPQVEEFLLQTQSPCGLVSGVTGYSPGAFKRLKALGEKHPVFWASNMSFGVFLMCQLTKTLARYHPFYEFHIEETHHIHKKDKPSGTALTIQKAAQESHAPLGPIRSHREGERFGEHRFIASGKNETLEIVHKAHDRELFAQGALEVALWLPHQPPGFYEMEAFFNQF